MRACMHVPTYAGDQPTIAVLGLLFGRSTESSDWLAHTTPSSLGRNALLERSHNPSQLTTRQNSKLLQTVDVMPV